MGESIKTGNLSFGIGTDLLVQIDGLDARLRSTLVGFKPGEYMLIEAPKANGLGARLIQGNKLSVVFISGGTVYGFSSVILSTVSQPSRLIFISFPDSLQTHDLRESQRVNCHLPAVVKFVEKNAEYNGVILDISPSGCSFNTVPVPGEKYYSFQLGSRVHLSFDLPGVENARIYAGEIRNLNLDEHIISLGVRFIELDDDIQRRIKTYIASVSEDLSSTI